MKNYYLFIPILVFSLSCSTGKADNEELSDEEILKRQIAYKDSLKAVNDSINMQKLIGSWNAEWETPPESYPEVKDMEFYMTGRFAFTEDSLTKTVNGYPGCIFAVDTLSHTQSWYVSGDTLFLMNGPDSPGMTYRMATNSDNRIRLQLMQDIFVTLTK